MSAALELALKRERWIVVAGLTVLGGLAWFYILAGAGMSASAWDIAASALFPHRPVADGSMSAMAMAQMDMAAMDMGDGLTAGWSLGHWLTMVAMWWTMMIAMMIPSAAPTMLLYGRVQRQAGRPGGTVAASELAPIGAFAAGYLLVWLGFSIAAAGLHWGLERMALMSTHDMALQSRWLGAGLLILTGLYQFSPAQTYCLRHCRSPAEFLTRHWRPGSSGALRLGVLHGAYCVGCCWMLMALLFVGGVMNLAWIALLTLLVLGEKLVARGVWIGRACGLVLVVWGAAMLVVR